MESTSELRDICQRTRETIFYKDPWISRHIYRVISIYFTRMFLKTGITANQVTLLGFLIGIIGVTFYWSSNPKFWLIGTFIFFVFMILDHVDGEIARYRKTSSTRGRYLDDITGYILRLYILICMSIGVYNVFSDIKVLFFGMMLIVFNSMFYISKLVPSGILYEMEKSSDIHTNTQTNDGNNSIITRFKNTMVSILGFQNMGYLIIALSAFIDIYLSPIQIFDMSLNARYIVLIFYTLATFVNMIISLFQSWFILKKVKPH
jgi:phosphatidylglycerophosphate synthase